MRSTTLATQLLLALLWLLLSCSSPNQAPEQSVIIDPGLEIPPTEQIIPAHLDTAKNYVGIEEVARNTGPEIQRFLQSVGLEGAYNYCAAFVSYCLDKSAATTPKVRSAVAQDFITGQSITAKLVLRSQTEIPKGSIVVWRRGNTWQGHTGFTTEAWSGPSGHTIEANTTPGPLGDQRQGQGIYFRERTIHPGNAFRITDFTQVGYEN